MSNTGKATTRANGADDHGDKPVGLSGTEIGEVEDILPPTAQVLH